MLAHPKLLNPLRHILFGCCLVFVSTKNYAQYPAAYSSGMIANAQVDSLKRVYLTPQRIVWKSNDSLITNSELLLQKSTGQAFFENRNICRITNKGNTPSGLILDFGKEIHGGIQITTSQSNRVTRKIRYGLENRLVKHVATLSVMEQQERKEELPIITRCVTSKLRFPDMVLLKLAIQVFDL